MRKRSSPHTFHGNLALRQRQLEVELAKIPDAATRLRLMQQIRDIELARQMESWLLPSKAPV